MENIESLSVSALELEQVAHPPPEAAEVAPLPPLSLREAVTAVLLAFLRSPEVPAKEEHQEKHRWRHNIY